MIIMNKIYVNQVGFLPGATKKAVLNFNSPEFTIVDSAENVVFK